MTERMTEWRGLTKRDLLSCLTVFNNNGSQLASLSAHNFHLFRIFRTPPFCLLTPPSSWGLCPLHKHRQHTRTHSTDINFNTWWKKWAKMGGREVLAVVHLALIQMLMVVLSTLQTFAGLMCHPFVASAFPPPTTFQLFHLDPVVLALKVHRLSQ